MSAGARMEGVLSGSKTWHRSTSITYCGAFFGCYPREKMYSYERKPNFCTPTFLNILLQEGGGDGDGDNYYDDWLQ